MNRMKKHRIKEEKATTSSTSRRQEEHDLAYFIHDRVELMHQVFSVLKSKELKSLAPECVRRLSIDDLQELCLEELLGISSKRLCAILDGAEPPSDTDSSSDAAEQLETISLDSISSDDEILSQASGKKKKHKHRHSKKKRRKKSKSGDEGESRASRAGLTVLELLELQARARAIRAQLHKEPAKTAEPAAEPPSSDNDEVLIKEEPAEVVEISSDDEKPDVKKLDQQIGASTSQSNDSASNHKDGDSNTVTKRINDLVITVPQSKPTRKIKLKRQKPTETVTKETTSNNVAEKEKVETRNIVISTVTNVKNTEPEPKKVNNAEAKNRSKKSKKKKKKVQEKEGSDEDEITIQLSDTEKMDLLEDLDVKNFDTVSSSDSDSSDGSDSENQDDVKQNDTEKQVVEEQSKGDDLETAKNKDTEIEIVAESKQEGEGKKDEQMNDNEETIELSDLPIISDDTTPSNERNDEKEEESNATKVDTTIDDKCDKNDEGVQDVSKEKTDDVRNEQNFDQIEIADEGSNNEKRDDKVESSSGLETKSDGEISDRESSEVEASDVQPEVVCISDDEHKKKKKKKKDKKSKKEKKKSGFREKTDENFYKDKVEDTDTHTTVIETIDDDDDDVYEYLEISDDSSCYEVEGVSVLSKEPTAEEIEAFSARMDEIDLEKDETVIPIPNENVASEPDTNDLENVSWKDRYLGSKKVKRVLTTSNILNAIRKKNKELKKKLEEAKKAELAEKEAQKEKEDNKPTVEDGTIEQYETLVGSTKYVDPVKEVRTKEDGKEVTEDTENKEDSENNAGLNKDESEDVTREMKKDAKQLLKMYKRLLKYNDINKQKDPNKKKKKKQKKNKDKEKNA
ncbi:protein PFC0760c [Leguminivora glycinivorella]|uniref:protein PFC0760c n=1 Tax=Leguminivora glycinivorella TaxID=1035111 RepID=UPI00200EF264|nr:protein PFC0760c [Leguminivora glycinivorella]